MSAHVLYRQPLLTRLFPILFGIACILAAFVVIEFLVKFRVLNPFIVPLPSEIAWSFERIILEEDVASRFLVTCGEALVASLLLTIFGISFGVLLHRVNLVRLATETWIAALASAPLVLVYPLFLVIFGRSAMTIIAIAFIAALPPVILKTLEGLAATRPVLIKIGRAHV